MIEISKAFSTSGEPVAEFFQRPGVGFYIPLYQREYSWDDENIEQLMEDICSSVETSVTDKEEDVILFLGTIILVTEKDPANNIKPLDNRALPTRIDNVIDGQQRISTIALLACLLYQKISELQTTLPTAPMLADLKEETRSKLLTLQELFSVDLRRGRPMRKPVIVRGSVDMWTFDGNETESYKSDVSLYLASFILSMENSSSFPAAPKNTLVGGNLKQMARWLKKVEESHKEKDDKSFPPAWELLERIPERDIWSYNRPELVEIIKNESPSQLKDRLCSIVQLFSFAHFLLYRCCFSLIEPVSDEWAFDMFQSLNATGTPLTAIETFKPMVVSKVNIDTGSYKSSESAVHFRMVDSLLGGKRTAAQKSRLTNEYLITFALTYDGSKLSSQFSKQRKWLTDKYDKCSSPEFREDFVHYMGDLATYWKDILEDYDPSKSIYLPKTEKVEEEEDKKIASLCILYLKDANHKMANTILSRFYSQILREKLGSEKEFVLVCKAIAAFFTLWRSALSNTGLDEVYRRLLRTDENLGQMSWMGDPNALTLDNLKARLIDELKEKGVWEKTAWMNKAEQNLRYDYAKVVCRFALFVTSHDTIVDSNEPGLMKIGVSGSRAYLTPDKWNATDFKTIEHIAPQRQQLRKEDFWDKELYQNDDYHRIGNLTLLPTDINSSAGNKRWIDKRIYYLHLAETDPDKLTVLEKEAKDYGVKLQPETIDLLKRTTHKHHIAPIVQINAQDKWDKQLVDRRTKRMCEILWDRIHLWLK